MYLASVWLNGTTKENVYNIKKRCHCVLGKIMYFEYTSLFYTQHRNSVLFFYFKLSLLMKRKRVKVIKCDLLIPNLSLLI